MVLRSTHIVITCIHNNDASGVLNTRTYNNDVHGVHMKHKVG